MATETEIGSNVVANNGNGHVSEAMSGDETSNFATRLFQNILATKESSDGNLLISPLLLEATLALLYLGSDGATAEQLQRQLQLNKRFSSNAKMANYYAAQLTAATGRKGAAETDTHAIPASTHIEFLSRIILPQNYEICDEFRKIAQKYFQTQATSNAVTHGSKEYRAPDAVEEASAILFVAANFQNKWFLPFSAYRTGSYDFYMPDKETSQLIARPIAMLFDDDMFVKFGEFRELDARAIELPYEWDDGNDMEDELSMLLILPNQRDGLARLEMQLCATNLNLLTERMQMESVQVLLPKFEIEFESSLQQSLQQLGISTIFSKEANFKNLLHENCQKTFRFESIIHKCSIEVNESGSDGAKAIAAGLKPIVISNSLNGRQKFFRADHPFFFVVRNSDAVFFMGQVTSF